MQSKQRHSHVVLKNLLFHLSTYAQKQYVFKYVVFVPTVTYKVLTCVSMFVSNYSFPAAKFPAMIDSSCHACLSEFSRRSSCHVCAEGQTLVRCFFFLAGCCACLSCTPPCCLAACLLAFRLREATMDLSCAASPLSVFPAPRPSTDCTLPAAVALIGSIAVKPGAPPYACRRCCWCATVCATALLPSSCLKRGSVGSKA